MLKIYSLWLQGYSHAPDQVKTCLDRWNKLNPNYTLEVFEWADVKNVLANFPSDINVITQQSISDIFRIALLQRTGGIWVDATVFPTKPLSEWMEETIGNAEFFSYRRETQQDNPKDRPISAWFLYAREDSIIIEKLWKETLRYWSQGHYPMIGSESEKYHHDPIAYMGLSKETPNEPYPYHWFQHIFAYLVKSDPTFARVWSSCPYKTMTNPHQMQFWVREELMNKDVKYLTEEKIKNIVENSEMQKLNWRMEFPIETMEKYSVSIPDGLRSASF